jgi:hypothetical protein
VHHMGLVVGGILVEEWEDQVQQEVQHMAMVKEGVSIMHPKVNCFPVTFTWWQVVHILSSAFIITC